jgi:hypothetical protein
MFASSLARHFEMDEEVVEDLMLAVSEACTRALVAAGGEKPLYLTVARNDGRLVFEVAQGDTRNLAGASNEELAAGLSLELIAALFADAEVVTDADGLPVVRFSIP